MTTLTAIFCALFGLAFGSFLNVCIERLPRHQSVVTPRSRCPHCGVQILARDNIPLLSWLLLKGRCRSCGAAISRRYSFVEAAAGGLFVACYLRFGMTVPGVGLGIFCLLMLGLAVMDAETMLLPDVFTLPGVLLGVLFTAAGSYLPGESVPGYSKVLAAAFDSILAAAVAAGLMLLIRGSYRLVRGRHGLGLGDAKLLAMIAAWLHLEKTLLTLFLAVVAAAVFAVGMLALDRRRHLPFEAHKERGHKQWLATRMPLGTFLAAAATYCVFFGDPTLAWYFAFFR